MRHPSAARAPTRRRRGHPGPGRMLVAAGRVEVMMLRATNLTKEYPVRGGDGVVHALTDVSLELGDGETLGIVGESGCGKSTLAKLLVRLEDPTSGTVELDGVDLTALRGRALRE